jgi:mono/diheme cytochrome c family protein
MFRFIFILIIIVIITISFSSQNYSDFKKQYNKATCVIQQNKIQTSLQPEEGIYIYQKYCLSCHQINGSGVPNMIPPLQKSDWVIGDKKKIISILMNGLQGEITVNDDIYRNTMPKQDYLTDEQIAKVLTYIRQNFENKASMVKPAEVSKLRTQKPK